MSDNLIKDQYLENNYLTFRLNTELFAIRVKKIKEIVDFSKIIKVPNANSAILGVINLRGDVIAVIDPLIRVGMQGLTITKRTSFVIVSMIDKSDNSYCDIAIMLDSVEDVIEIKSSDIKPPPEYGKNINKKFIEVMCEFKNNFVVAFDVDELLNLDDLSKV